MLNRSVRGCTAAIFSFKPERNHHRSRACGKCGLATLSRNKQAPQRDMTASIVVCSSRPESGLKSTAAA